MYKIYYLIYVAVTIIYIIIGDNFINQNLKHNFPKVHWSFALKYIYMIAV